jgi:hypothetical protein
MSTRATAFDHALRDIAVPALSSRGFRFDGGRSFRRRSGDRQRCAIINFQLGQRSMAGRFTVNLGVFAEGDSPGVDVARAREHDCRFDRRTRLGQLVPHRFSRLARLPYVGNLFGPRDRWWSFSDDGVRTQAAMSAVVDLIVVHGLHWLDTVAAGSPIASSPLRGAA